MQKIVVKNFGPLEDIDLEIKDYMLFIGENASGKSTLLKLIYFFNKLPEHIYESYNERFGTNSGDDGIGTLHWHLLSYDLYTEFLINTEISFHYSSEKEIKLVYSPDSTTSYKAIYSSGFNSFFEKCKEVREFYELKLAGNNQGQHLFLQVKTDYLIEIREYINRNFNNILSKNKLFFPESKSLLSTGNFKSQNSLYSDFLEQTSSSQFFLRSQLEAGISNSVIEAILKGKPIKISDKWYGIELENGKQIPYFQLSSGQKELYWMLLILYSLSTSNDEGGHSVFIEEPETHLHSDSFKILGEFFSLLFNTLNTKFYVTTHSYFVLGVINNLINAFRIGKINPDEVGKIIPKEYWLDSSKVYVGELREGKITNIYDKETGLYDLEYMSRISEIINRDYDKLLDIEFEEEK